MLRWLRCFQVGAPLGMRLLAPAPAGSHRSQQGVVRGHPGESKVGPRRHLQAGEGPAAVVLFLFSSFSFFSPFVLLAPAGCRDRGAPAEGGVPPQSQPAFLPLFIVLQLQPRIFALLRGGMFSSLSPADLQSGGKCALVCGRSLPIMLEWNRRMSKPSSFVPVCCILSP